MIAGPGPAVNPRPRRSRGTSRHGRFLCSAPGRSSSTSADRPPLVPSGPPSRPAAEPAGGGSTSVGLPGDSEVEAEEEVHERVAEVAVAEIDGRVGADLEAAADVEAQHERRAEGSAEAEAVAAPRPFRLLVLEPARAGIHEDRARDPGEPDLPEREREGEAVEDGETPFLVDQPDARARQRVAGVSAELVCAAEDGATRDGAVAVEAEQADRVRAVQRRAEIAPVVAEEDVVLRRHAALDLVAAHLTGQRAVEAGDRTRREVEPLAVDGPRRQPERVVLDEGEIVGRQDAFAREIPRVRPWVGPDEAAVEGILGVYAVAVLETEAQLDAVELGERIARQEIAAVGLLLVDVEDHIAEQTFEAEDAGAVIQPVRQVQVQEVPAEVVDELADVLGLRSGHAEEEDVIAEHVASEQLRALRGADAGRDD